MTMTTTTTRSDNLWEEEVEDWATWLIAATQQQLDAECSFHWNFVDNDDAADADGIECRYSRRTRRRSSSSLTPVSRLPFWMLLVGSVILAVLLPSQQLGGGDGYGDGDGDGERAQPSPSWVVSSFQPSPSLYYSGSGRAIQANFQRSLSPQQRSRILCKTYTGGSNTDLLYPSAAINTRRSLPLKSRTTGTARAFSSSSSSSSSSTTTALRMVWWYGGSESVDEVNVDQQGLVDSCELVAVRIERTSPNSRRIVGEIIVPTPVDDVWAILTDYDRLALHVPNLVESKIIQSSPSQQQQQQQLQRQASQQGDGNFSCRLFQRGAQKIVGFDFSAAVTMDMQERIVPLTSSLSSLDSSDGSTEERRIYFKCVESFFFQEFDGTWKARERINDMTGQPETVLSYSVDVRPKGPVPVAALEWRIREDVPTNLRAVKKAAMQVGYAGVMAARYPHRTATATMANPGGLVTSATLPIRSQQTQQQQQEQQQQLLALPSVASSNDSSSKRMASPTNNRNNSSKEIAAKKPTSAAIFSSSSTTTTQRSTTSLQERRNTVLSNLKVKWYKDETMATYLKDPQ